MHELDATDLEILELLSEDGRRPFSEIADRVDLSGPAVSDRVDRMVEAGVIEGFTVEVDRSQLQAGVPVLVGVGEVEDPEALRDRLTASDAVEHVFVTANGEVQFTARPPGQSIRRWLLDELGLAAGALDVTLLDDVTWTPSIGGGGFALSCAECGNTVDSEGERATIEGETYYFCCASCEAAFQSRHRRIAEDA